MWLRCQSETSSNGEERQSKGFNHTARSYNHVNYTHVGTHFTVASKGVMMTAVQIQAVSERLCVICKSQQGPAGRWRSSAAKSWPPLTCSPVTSCLLAIPSPPPLTCCATPGPVGSPGRALRWVGLTEGQPQHAPNIRLVVFFHLPPPWIHIQLLNHRWTAADGSWQPVWLPARLTACGYAKCTDFHILMLRSGVIWKHATRDCWRERASWEGVCGCLHVYSILSLCTFA